MTIECLKGNISENISQHGFALMLGTEYEFPELEDAWRTLTNDWEHLETDKYMADGGQYRLRRYGRFSYLPAKSRLQRLPHATVFQKKDINNFAGGIHRMFAPLRESTCRNPFLLALIRFDFSRFEVTKRKLSDPWEVWVHQIRIETSGESVPPAPEGIHHDGHDLIAMHLVKRDNIEGGCSRIYDNSKTPLFFHLLERPLDSIYADDHQVMHAVDPIGSLDGKSTGRRDILIIDFDHKPNL